MTARRVLRTQGRTAIVLVPEIALTSQTVDRFRGAFGDDVRPHLTVDAALVQAGIK